MKISNFFSHNKLKHLYLVPLVYASLGELPAKGFLIVTSNSEVGNDLINRNSFDGSNGGVFVMTEQSFNTSAAFKLTGVVSSWSFVGNHPASGNFITPFIVQEFGAVNPSYVVRGIGTTRQTTRAPGVQTYEFGLQSGNDFVQDTGDYYFGWYDGNLNAQPVSSGTNNGVIGYDSSNPLDAGTVLFFGGAGYEGMSVGFDLSSRGATLPMNFSRVYSVVAYVPEPGTATLFLFGMVGLFACRRRSQKT